MTIEIEFLKHRGHRVVLIDDSETNLKVLEAIVNGVLPEPRVVLYTNPKKATDYIVSTPDISLVIVDYRMPVMTGKDVLRRIRTSGHGFRLPVLMVSALGEEEIQNTSYDAGATDFIRRPVKPALLRQKISNLILAQQAIRERDGDCRETVFEREGWAKMIRTLITIKQVDHPQTAQIVINTARLMMIGAGMSRQEQERIIILYLIADIGKIGLPHQLQVLRDEESLLSMSDSFNLHNHVQLGQNILLNSGDAYLRSLADAVLHHHENWDGSGYPRRLSGNEIPREARFVRLLHGLDNNLQGLLGTMDEKAALVEAVGNLSEGAGTLYDPELVSLITRVVQPHTRVHAV